MASPRRARSLFLSPDKAELLAAKEINNLVQRVEVIPRKPVPRQGRRTNIVVETNLGNDSRMSTTSTLRAVDAFCKEYRPPSVALHRLSYLNKELPPPPLIEMPNQTLSHGNTVSRRSTQKHAAVQTTISIQSRYSTGVKNSTPSRLSTISSQHIASQQRDSEDRISIRSRFSAQDFPVELASPRSEPLTSASIDRRRPSLVGDLSKEDARRQNSGSISPGTVPHQEHDSAAVGRKIRISGLQEAEIASQVCQDIQDPLTGTDSNGIVLRSKSKRETTVGWTFHDGLVLRTDGKVENATRIRSEGGNLAVEPISKHMIPIRWTFHDGILYKATEIPRNEDGMLEAKSKRSLPIDWSFYDGLTIKSDGSIGAVSKVTGKSDEVAHGSKSRLMLPTGWTFHDGLIFAYPESVKLAHVAPDKSNGTETDASLKRPPIAWTFHDGLTLRTRSEVRNTLKTAPIDTGEIATKSKSKRSVGWSFNDGLVIRNVAGLSPTDGQLMTTTRSKRSITWTFNDGLTVKAHGRTGPSSRRVVTGSKSRRIIGWSFHDGLVIGRDDGVARRSPRSRRMAANTMPKQMPLSWSFADGLTRRRRPTSNGKGKGVDRNLHPLILGSKTVQRRHINYGFWDGITFQTIDKRPTRVSSQPQSKLRWSFYDGVSRTITGEASGQVPSQCG